jgi:pyruvate dehydrogenase (quinone)
VKRIFGYPGDGITGIMGALHRAGNEPELIQVRHEEMASLMACAHAKFTGEVGVCLATSGPGAIHLLNGLYDAKMDHMPVVAIVGQQALASLGGDYQQEVDLVSLYKDVANEYVHVLADPVQARHLVDRAFRIAKAERTVTCLVVPYDVQELEAVEQPPHAHGSIFSGVGYSEPRVVPLEEDLLRAAEVLNSGERVAILVGAGALGATDEVIEVADALGAGVAKALLGMAALPDDLPFVTGGIGPIGREPSWDLMMGCDTVLMVGSSMPYTEYMPQPGQARGVQIDLDGRMLGIRYPMEVNLVGDSAETLRALLPHLRRKKDRTWRGEIEGEVRRFWGSAGERAKTDADPLNPMRVFWELSERLPDGCILIGDSGSVVSWMCQAVKLRRGMMWSLSGGLATMGSGVPYAIAAKLAHPDRPVVAVVGDGAMQMNGNAELLTVANHWERWADPRLVVLVLNTRDLSFVSWEQRFESGDPLFPASQKLPDFPYAGYAELLGLKGIRVERPEDVAGAWEEALSADRPVVLEAVTDPDVPPMPLSHVRPGQEEALASALEAGDSGVKGSTPEAFKEKFEKCVQGEVREVPAALGPVRKVKAAGRVSARELASSGSSRSSSRSG